MRILITGGAGFIGSTEEITILQLAERIIELTRSSSQIEFVSYDEAYGVGFEDMRRRVPDIAKINKMVGWVPEISLRETLSRIINYYSAE